VRAEQKMVDARAVGINRSLKDFRPDFGVNLEWDHTGGNFPEHYMATVEVKIPINTPANSGMRLKDPIPNSVRPNKTIRPGSSNQSTR
jgi:hypothetical protein